jgi:ADP-heptose:LPS heptosyltransferase
MSGELAVLFAPSLRAAWEAKRCRRVVGTPTDFRSALLTDRVEPREHLSDTFAALCDVVGAVPEGPPVYGARGSACEVPVGHVGLNPIARGGTSREWTGYFELAVRLGRPVVFYAGPGEAERLEAIAGGFPRVVGTRLPDFAATLDRCAVFVSNDSGAAHFARACGVETIVVHGSTTASRTGADGALGLENPVPCHPCYRPDCSVGLGCLETPVWRVQRAVEQCLSS